MNKFCCDAMQLQAELVCDQHPERFDCPDCLIHYSPRFREFGLIIHDGGPSSITIYHCPWCGSKLPASLRDEWFAEMERRGIDPAMDEVPEEFRSSAWWAVKQAEAAEAPEGRFIIGS